MESKTNLFNLKKYLIKTAKTTINYKEKIDENK